LFVGRSNLFVFSEIKIASTLKKQGFDFVEHFVVRNDDLVSWYRNG